MGNTSDIRCPFYGLSYSRQENMFTFKNGNQCGLIPSHYCPCNREMFGKSVEWLDCRLNNPETSARIEWMIKNAKIRLNPDRADFRSESSSFKEHYDSFVLQKQAS